MSLSSISNIPNPLFAKLDSKTNSSCKIAETKVVGKACSENGHGVVDKNRLPFYFKKLVKHAASGVLFKEKLLESSCWGGTCSAQSLRFASLFFSPQYALLDLHERFISVAKACETSSLDLRTQQAALNSITEDKEHPSADFSRAKIESIVALQDFEVVYASEPIAHQNGEISLEDFEQTIIKLPEGVYFTRLLASTDNHKKEAYGHSVLFINSSEGCYFWDPMGNSYQLADKQVVANLHEIIGGTKSRWGLENPRFYKILPKSFLHKSEKSNLYYKIKTAFQSGVSNLAAAA